MADTPGSQLPQKTTLAQTDLLVIVDMATPGSPVTKSAPVSDLNSLSSIVQVNQAQLVALTIALGTI